MSDWIIPIALVIAWVIIAGSTWLYVRHTEARAHGAYVNGWEDGWKQHVAAQLSEDPEYRRAYTEGWLACLETLDAQTPGWRDRPVPAPGSPFAGPPNRPPIPEFDEKGIRP